MDAWVGLVNTKENKITPRNMKRIGEEVAAPSAKRQRPTQCQVQLTNLNNEMYEFHIMLDPNFEGTEEEQSDRITRVVRSLVTQEIIQLLDENHNHSCYANLYNCFSLLEQCHDQYFSSQLKTFNQLLQKVGIDKSIVYKILFQ